MVLCVFSVSEQTLLRTGSQEGFIGEQSGTRLQAMRLNFALEFDGR